MNLAEPIIAAVVVLIVIIVVIRSVRIVPQARARNVERFGRYRKTLEPGMNFIIPVIDRVKKEIDLREQVVSFTGQPVITEDNLVVQIDTVLFFQVTDPRAADYEIVNYIQAIEQITATMLRSVIGSMDLEQTLTSRDKINTLLRGVLDEASGKWGIRVTRMPHLPDASSRTPRSSVLILSREVSVCSRSIEPMTDRSMVAVICSIAWM